MTVCKLRQRWQRRLVYILHKALEAVLAHAGIASFSSLWCSSGKMSLAAWYAVDWQSVYKINGRLAFAPRG